MGLFPNRGKLGPGKSGDLVRNVEPPKRKPLPRKTAEYPGYKNKKQAARGGTRREVIIDTISEGVMSRLERVSKADREAAAQADEIKNAALERKAEAAKKVSKVPASAPEAERRICERQLRDATKSARQAERTARRAKSKARKSAREINKARKQKRKR